MNIIEFCYLFENIIQTIRICLKKNNFKNKKCSSKETNKLTSFFSHLWDLNKNMFLSSLMNKFHFERNFSNNEIYEDL